MALTLDSARATFALFAKAQPTAPGTDSNERQTLGVGQTDFDYSDADIFYTRTITSTTAADVAQITIASGAVATTNGAPTIARSGSDYEGNTLTSMVTVYGILYQTDGVDWVNMAASNGEFADVPTFGEGGAATCLMIPANSAGTAVSGTIAMSFNAGGVTVKVSILGKSS